MFGHTMRMVLGLGVFVGMIAYGWTTVLGTLNDVAIREAGVPPKVWHAFKRYKPEGELEDIRQVVAFMEETAQGGFPPSFLRGQFMEFCQDDVSKDPSHNLEACRACFNLLIDDVFARHEQQAKRKKDVATPKTASAVGSVPPQASPQPSTADRRREKLERRARMADRQAP